MSLFGLLPSTHIWHHSRLSAVPHVSTWLSYTRVYRPATGRKVSPFQSIQGSTHTVGCCCATSFMVSIVPSLSESNTHLRFSAYRVYAIPIDCPQALSTAAITLLWFDKAHFWCFPVSLAVWMADLHIARHRSRLSSYTSISGWGLTMGLFWKLIFSAVPTSPEGSNNLTISLHPVRSMSDRRPLSVTSSGFSTFVNPAGIPKSNTKLGSRLTPASNVHFPTDELSNHVAAYTGALNSHS